MAAAGSRRRDADAAGRERPSGRDDWRARRGRREFILSRGGEPAFKGYRVPGGYVPPQRDGRPRLSQATTRWMRETSCRRTSVSRFEGFVADSAYTFAVGRFATIRIGC